MTVRAREIVDLLAGESPARRRRHPSGLRLVQGSLSAPSPEPAAGTGRHRAAVEEDVAAGRAPASPAVAGSIASPTTAGPVTSPTTAGRLTDPPAGPMLPGPPAGAPVDEPQPVAVSPARDAPVRLAPQTPGPQAGNGVAPSFPSPRDDGVTPPWYGRYRAVLLVVDATMVTLTLLAAQFARFGVRGAEGRVFVAGELFSYAVVGAAFAAVWMLALSANESRNRRVVGAGLDEYRKVVTGTFTAFGIVAIGSYLLQIELSRVYFAVAFPLGLAFVLLGRLALRIHLGARRREGRHMTGVVVVGSRPEIRRALDELRRNPEAGYRAVAVSIVDAQDDADRHDGLPHVPRRNLRAFVDTPAVGAVVVAGGLPRMDIRLLAWELENTHVELMLVSQLTDVAGPRVHASPAHNLPMVHVDLPQYSGFNHLAKRALDVVVASLILVAMAPVLALVALAIKLEDGGPVIFRQQRVGQNGETFTMHKLRSMALDAEDRLAELRGHDDGNGVLFKMRDDPRVTRVGRLIRRFSLDEFPQFFDVLLGRMSVVGPRPPLPCEVDGYAGHVRRRLLTRPGITGLWQVSGRSDLSWEDGVRLDLAYVENWSVAGDLIIILKTAKAVISARGAY
ncbi:exopolysaccharide biosynthesis polyprenyl glycosylphosphotransferase [Georgenia muralis]